MSFNFLATDATVAYPRPVEKFPIPLGPLATRKNSHTGVSRFLKPLRQIRPIETNTLRHGKHYVK